MIFNSIQFMLYFPIVTLVYFLLKPKVRIIWLLIASYYFYMCWNPKYAVLIGFSTVVTYLSGLLISKANEIEEKRKRIFYKRLYVFLSLAINLGILFAFKYYNFFVSIVTRSIGIANISIALPVFDIMLPVGISFYTFQALSYTIDIYRNDVKAEKNIFKYALFVSFFPQLVAGPIEKSKDLLDQFNLTHKFEYNDAKNGLILMIWGIFQKLVVADRVAILVNIVYNSPEDYFGIQLIVSTLFFAFQIYCDFASYSNIAIGAAQVLGYKLTTNFEQPYFSKSIKEFWRRWHISLGSWFRDYLYIPLDGNRKGKKRTYINIMIVFLFSGLWHGASLNYVAWGGLHGIYQVIGDILKPIRRWCLGIFKIKANSKIHNFIQVCITFILVNFAWVFFRANSFRSALIVIRNMFKLNLGTLIDGSIFNLGLGYHEFIVAIIGISIIIFVDLISNKANVLDKISKRNCIVRWSIYISVIIIIVIFGSYGVGYDSQQFIYFQF